MSHGHTLDRNAEALRDGLPTVLGNAKQEGRLSHAALDEPPKAEPDGRRVVLGVLEHADVV